MRETVRAVLFDSSGKLITIRRKKPGVPPYYTTPGGGVEPGESHTQALRRELFEELGATAQIGRVVFVQYDAAPQSVQFFYEAKLSTMDIASRNGPEFKDLANRGTYDIVSLSLTDEALGSLKPTAVAEILRSHGNYIQQYAIRLGVR